MFFPLRQKISIGQCELDANTTRIIAPLIGKNTSELINTIQVAKNEPIDIFEWRLDFFNTTVSQDIVSTYEELQTYTDKPILVTLRTYKEGGQANIDDFSYGEILRNLIVDLPAPAIDIEVFRGGSESLIRFAHQYGKCVIGSYHNFNITPTYDELIHIFEDMSDLKVDISKIAVMPKTQEDVLTLVKAAHDIRQLSGVALMAISMGELGKASRYKISCYGGVATFACLENASAPGQISVREMRQLLDQYDGKETDLQSFLENL